MMSLDYGLGKPSKIANKYIMFNVDYGWLTYGNEQFRWKFD